MKKKKIKVRVVRTKEPSGVILWGFGYATLSELFEVSHKTIKRWIEAGKLDPTDLKSVVDFYNKRTLERVTCPLSS